MAGAKAKVGIKVVDKGWDELAKTLKAIRRRKSYVKAGVIGKSKERKDEGDGLTNVELAIIHEFGAPKAGIPERSFIRSTFDEKRPEYTAILAGLLRQVYEGRMDVERALNILGLKMVADQKAKITTGIPPPNSPATLRVKEAKGRKNMGRKEGPLQAPKTLIDTGQLRNSLTHEVVLSGKKDE